jgi:hypothetical protein
VAKSKKRKRNWERICRTAHSAKTMRECWRRGYMPEPGFEMGVGALKKKRGRRKKRG